MKKWMNGLLAFVLAFTLTACGAAGTVGDGGDAGQRAEATQTEQSAEAQEADEAGVDAEEAESEDAEAAESEDDGEQASDEQKQQDVAVDVESEDAAPDEQLAAETTDNGSAVADAATLAEDGTYTTKEDVAAYIHAYGHLPNNFITKKEAEKLGWSGGSLEPYAPGKCIGGSRFGNYEGVLPEKDGRKYIECDIDTLGASKRGAKRIVFSNDGLIYYTGDHYETFELLYGEE